MSIPKNILLVSSAFYPEISPRSFRATELAKEFCKRGHNVKVITKYRNFDYSGFLDDYSIILKMWGKHKLPKVPTCKSRPLSFFTRAVARILLYFFEYPAIEELFKVRRILRSESGYDLAVSFAVPYAVHWGMAWSKTDRHPITKTWVADCGDPYMGDVLDSFRKPFYFSFLEKNFCRKADYITIPVESALPAYYQEFHHKIHVIPQGFDFDKRNYETKIPSDGVPKFAYAGRFIQGVRDPSFLLKFLVNINIPFRFYLYTNQPELLDDLSVNLGEKLVVYDYVPRDELLRKLSGMDFLINFDNNTPLNVPSKLIDYAILGLPVLNIDRNFVVDDLISFLNGDYHKSMILPNPEHYHIKNVSQKFLNLI